MKTIKTSVKSHENPLKHQLNPIKSHENPLHPNSLAAPAYGTDTLPAPPSQSIFDQARGTVGKKCDLSNKHGDWDLCR